MRVHRPISPRETCAGLCGLLALAASWLIGAAATAQGPAAVIVEVEGQVGLEGRRPGGAAAVAPVQAPASVVVPTVGPVLHLSSGGFMAGELGDSADPGVVRWQSPHFVAPFDVALSGVEAVHWPPPPAAPNLLDVALSGLKPGNRQPEPAPPKPVGDYCFELSGGDVLFGSLVELGDEDADLDVPRIGRTRVRRSRIHRIYRMRDAGDLIYLGPNGLTDWRETSDPKGWREEGGQLLTDRAGAALVGDVKLPAKSVIELELSWKTKPDFSMALGVGDEKSAERAFRFEIWAGDLVVQRETSQEADVAKISAIAPGPGRIHLQAYLDQERGRILVFSANGQPMADLMVGDRRAQVLGGIRLANLGGDVRLERLRVGRWNGEAPRPAPVGHSRIHRTDGTIVYGQVTRYDAEKKEFVVREETGEARVAADQIASIFLSPPADEPPQAVRVVYHDGTRLGGELTRVKNGHLWLTMPGFLESTRLPISGLRSLVSRRHEANRSEAIPPPVGVGRGRLEMEGVRLPGRLVDAREQPGSSCLAWQPLGCDTASPLRPGVSGRIIYKEPPPPQTPTQAQIQMQQMQQLQRRRAGRVVMGGNIVIRGRGAVAFDPNVNQAPTPTGGGRAIYLRTGDIIPCEVTKIDEDGVSFRTPISESTFVPHNKVKAVELAPGAMSTVRLNKAKRDRLLTLPRMQRDSPPTQLIRSKNGDYLRGRVLAMDKKTLQVEVRLEAKEVPRDRISRIIWLHADELDPSKAPARPAAVDAGTRVQALRSDGIRLTFFADRFEDETLMGKSDVLGSCRVKLDAVDQLLIDGAIEPAASQLAYQRWRLQNAEEPKVQDDASGGGSTGTESAMVGKPAPDFELDLLKGKKFRLSETKGKVVVLDFWATWCGPCLQAMPQVDRVAHEFKDQGVQLVAVNLQEAPDTISALLERQKLDLTVALDRNGIVAEKYGANAIPQTVIIGRDGNVARLFVGGGPHFEDQLREAMKAVLAGEAPKEMKK